MTVPGLLTLDVGNTNASLAFVFSVDDGGVMVCPISSWAAAEDEREELALALNKALELGFETELAAMSVVGSGDREALLKDQIAASGLSVLARPGAGLDLRLRNPETCGSDRKYAARAALEDLLRVGSTTPVRAIVVDAGTALTVDACCVEGNDLVFLGGAIALGPGMLARSLSEAGARLPAPELNVDAQALGRSTVEAMQSGVTVGFRGSVRELCMSVAEEAFGGVDGVVAFLTGGARSFARAAVRETFPGNVREDAFLVHRGLASAAHWGERP